jgi:hypothetical protein
MNAGDPLGSYNPPSRRTKSISKMTTNGQLSGVLYSCPLSLYGYYIWWDKVGHYVLYLIHQVKPDIYDTTNCVPHYYLFYMTSHIICRRQILLYVITYNKITYHHLIPIHLILWGTNYKWGFLWWGN